MVRFLKSMIKKRMGELLQKEQLISKCIFYILITIFGVISPRP